MKKKYLILETIKNRRTVRRFNEKSVPLSILKTLLDAARWAPCPNGLQPWKFFIAKKGNNTTDKIIKYLEERNKTKNIGAAVFLNDAINILKRAPIVIYVFNSRILTKKLNVIGAYYERKGNIFEHQAIAAAIENLLLCAEEFGLGAVWLGSPLFVSSGIENILNTDFELCAIIGLGFYDIKPKVTHRLPVNAIVEFI